MCRPVVIAGIAIHNRFPAADEFQDITSKSKPTPEKSNHALCFLDATRWLYCSGWHSCDGRGRHELKSQSSRRSPTAIQGTWLTAITLINQTGATSPL